MLDSTAQLSSPREPERLRRSLQFVNTRTKTRVMWHCFCGILENKSWAKIECDSRTDLCNDDMYYILLTCAHIVRWHRLHKSGDSPQVVMSRTKQFGQEGLKHTSILTCKNFVQTMMPSTWWTDIKRYGARERLAEIDEKLCSQLSLIKIEK